MKILIISTMDAAPWGGSEELWSDSALQLISCGHRVAVSVKAWPTLPAKLRLLSERGVVVHRRPRTIFSRLINRVSDPYQRVLRSSKPDLVLISQGANFDGMHCMEICRRCRVPYAALSQAAAPWMWPDDNHVDMLRDGYTGARRSFFVSEENRRLTEKQLCCDLQNAKVIRNSCKMPSDAPIPDWPTGEIARWAFVARLEAYVKGHDLLFDVMVSEKWRQRPIRVTLYGRGTHQRVLRQLAERMALTNVEFAGFVESPRDIWKREQCLILPSRAEGLPLALVEAMLCGRPCIVTGVSGNPELLEDNVTGFIAQSATVNALDEAMERAWQNRMEWPSMGRRAAESIRRLIPPDPAQTFAEELLALL